MSSDRTNGTPLPRDPDPPWLPLLKQKIRDEKRSQEGEDDQDQGEPEPPK